MSFMCFSKISQRLALTFVSPLLLPVLCAPARAQNVTSGRFGPDQLQTLAVGARAIGMGSAYSIIANDSSATFWNPACLDNIIGRRQFDIEYRTVPQALRNNMTQDGTLLKSTATTNINDPQISYIGFAVPVQIHTFGKLDPNTGVRTPETHNFGTLGFSYALGGYSNLQSVSTDIVTLPVKTTTYSDVTSIVRNSFFTVAYGNNFVFSHGTSRVQYGAGVFYVSQDQLLQQGTSINNPNVLTSLSSDHQDGVGFIIGATYRQDYRDKKTNNLTPGKWIYGFSYRSGPSLSGANSSLKSFDSELPDRLAVGLAYSSSIRQRDQLTIAGEVQYLSSANQATQLDVRRAATNFNIGAEYVPNSLKSTTYRIPIRLGFHTIDNANTNLFSYDDAITMGVGFQTTGHAAVISSFEAGLEYLTVSSKLQYSLSARFRF